MTSTLAIFWRQLRRFVHPRDQRFLRTIDEHPFHLNFPPPAYSGDIDRAPVILLTANGGWIDDAAVKEEMRLFGGQKKYLDYLHNPRPMQLNEMNVWVRAQFYAPLVEKGLLATVNAIAYRSKDTKDIANHVAKNLPSANVARDWLRNEVFPAAKSGDRLVIAHRWKFWHLNIYRDRGRYIRFSEDARSPHLAKQMQESVLRYLRRRGRL